uniref:Myb-like domain-containing protein n=2 Tax=Physcomitrium patens TaxID=3218 RepID=A0A7I4ERD8_PHYPA
MAVTDYTSISANVLDDFAWDLEDEVLRNPSLAWKNTDRYLFLEKEASQPGIDYFVAAGTPSDSDVDGVKKMECWIGDDNQPKTRKKRCREYQAPTSHYRERQRGKNWKEAEENILVESRGKGMDWKSISECLKNSGFTRNEKHCTDKWYALRKHYIDIHDWITHHPESCYWSLSDSDRIRTVPHSFCQKWYEIFDAAERREGRKNRASLHQRRRQDNDEYLAIVPPSSLFGANLVGVPSNSTSRIDSVFASRPQEFSQRHVGDSNFLGDASHENERPETGDFLLNQDASADWTLSRAEIRMLVKEIRGLNYALQNKFAREEEERSRNLRIKEQKLQLKQDRFNYKRQRDDEARRAKPRQFDGFNSV